jgi:CHASE2 domain-containing sensor protein/nitrogen-specific signal transduction histidine kinase
LVSGPESYIRQAVREWAALLAFLLLLAAALTLTSSGQRAMQSLSREFFDFSVNHISVGPSAVTVVAIDESSIAQLGRWPWRRAIHSALLDRIATYQPAAIGLDILFSESSEDDAMLATSFRRFPAITLAAESVELASGRRLALLATDSVLTSNVETAHVSVRNDIDGSVRSVVMSEGGLPAFSLKLADQAAKQLGRPLSPRWHHTLQTTRKQDQLEQFQQGNWTTGTVLQLPFGAANPGHRLVSYGAVLRGEVDASAFRNRIVLVGAVANGLGDYHVTPNGLQAGVLLHAQAISAIQNNRSIRIAPAWLVFVLTGFIVCAVMAGIFKLKSGLAMAWTLFILLLALSISIAALWSELLWLDSMAAVVLCALAYPLWSWRRLKAAVTGLATEAQALTQTPFPWPRPIGSGAQLAADPLGQQLTFLSQAASQLRVANKFYSKTLDAQPHPVLVIGAHQRIMFANSAAQQAFTGALQANIEQDASQWISTVFADFRIPEVLQIRMQKEARDRAGRDWLVSLESVDNEKKITLPDLTDVSRVLLQLVDISALRAAQRERDEAMRFLSHDIRSPQVSLINWVAQERKAGVLPAAALNAVELHSQHALEMADSFLRLARAETQEMAQDEVSMGILCDEAVDALHATAKQKNVRLEQSNCEHDVVIGDASLLRRALVNLIGNAIHYGPSDSKILVRVESHDDFVVVDVCDCGEGVSREEAEQIFKPYVRGTSGSGTSGTGLGLTFVRTVAARHYGAVEVYHADPVFKSVFRLRLPMAQHFHPSVH